jgi:hypothetical protein
MKTIATQIINGVLIALFTITAAYVSGSIILAIIYQWTDYTF